MKAIRHTPGPARGKGGKMDRIVDQLASYADSLAFEKIPSPAIQQAKRLAIDALGCAMGGAESQPSRIARTVAMETTGPWRATVLATGQKALPDLAAFANGTMIRYLDYNDTCIKNLGIFLLRNGTRKDFRLRRIFLGAEWQG
jgi:2-methylcitrate dehydratase PrpD